MKTISDGEVVHAGRLAELPGFDNGMGISAKVSAIESASKFHDINTQLTINTGFAETEVDAGQTNLTRFPLYFPEKRGFFLEGSALFDFGIGTAGDPSGKNKEWVFGEDLTYYTSKFLDDKNIAVGIWGLYNKNGLNKDGSAAGFKIDYPNDILDMGLTVLRIGDGFSAHYPNYWNSVFIHHFLKVDVIKMS